MRVIGIDFAVDGHGAGVAVDDQAAVLHAGHRGLVVAPAQHGAYPSLELGKGERLDDEVVRAQIEHADPLLLRVTPGADDHRHRAVTPDLGQNLGPVDAGQAQVQDDQVGRVLEDGAQRRRAVGGLRHPVATALEVVVERGAATVVVFGHQDRALAAALEDVVGPRRVGLSLVGP